MEKLSKLTLIALALVLLASCSKDDELKSSDANYNLEENSAEFRKAPDYGDLQCGTPGSNAPLPLNQWQVMSQVNSFSPLPPIDVEIQYHIVRTDAGADGIPISELETITSNINANFDLVLYGILNFVIAPDRLNFINSGYDYIDDTDFYFCESNEFGPLTSINNDPNKINIYIVKELISSSTGNPIGGLGATPGNRLITNRQGNTYLGSSPAHEIGHNLGMNHTHHMSTGLCVATDNYSSVTGDRIYDTPLDLSMSQQVSTACTYTGSQATNCGEFVGPGISDPHEVVIPNTMSYARHACRIGFSGLQHIQMNAQAINSGLGQLGESEEIFDQ